MINWDDDVLHNQTILSFIKNVTNTNLKENRVSDYLMENIS